MNTYQQNIKLRDDMLSGQQDLVKTYIMFVDDLEVIFLFYDYL